MRIRVGHLYPEYLNIYADRGNIAVLERRAAARGHEIELVPLSFRDRIPRAGIDLFYVGGGQDREQALIAPDLAEKGPAIAEAVAGGAVVLAVCGGYQLLGRYYKDRAGTELPGIGLLPLHTEAGIHRMIGDVVITCDWAGERLAGFENHIGQTILEAGAEPLGRIEHGFGNDGDSGYEGCRSGRVYGTYLHGPLLPRNPWFADRLILEAIEHRSEEPVELAPLDDALERAAFDISVGRAAARGGRF